jgi:hypothetical protein
MPEDIIDGDPIFESLRARLVENPAARANFLADVLNLLGSNGVDTSDPNVVNRLGLETDIADGERFVDGTLASTAVLTITQ